MSFNTRAMRRIAVPPVRREDPPSPLTTGKISKNDGTIDTMSNADLKEPCLPKRMRCVDAPVHREELDHNVDYEDAVDEAVDQEEWIGGAAGAAGWLKEADLERRDGSGEQQGGEGDDVPCGEERRHSGPEAGAGHIPRPVHDGEHRALSQVLSSRILRCQLPRNTRLLGSLLALTALRGLEEHRDSIPSDV
eukprot:7385038-Prymnesium_polylepis.1